MPFLLRRLVCYARCLGISRSIFMWHSSFCYNSIFYTIKNFGAVVFTLIMTTRILISIAVSCIMYGHQVSATGFFGLMLVLAAVLYRIRRKAQGHQLLKWQGMEDDAKEHELVQEWHEHVDM